MSISLPPRPPGLDDVRPLDQEALIEEARRRARRRRQRNLAGLLAAMLGALWLYSLVGGGGPRERLRLPVRAVAPGRDAPEGALPRGALLQRERRRRPHPSRRHTPGPRAGDRSAPAERPVDHSAVQRHRVVARRLEAPCVCAGALRARSSSSTRRARSAPTIAQALDGRWSPDGTRIAFMRHEPGFGRVLFLAASDGRDPIRIATHIWVFSWSPTGSELAYIRAEHRVSSSQTPAVVRMPRRVTIAAARVHLRVGAECSGLPTASLIAFTTGSGVFVVRPDGTSLRQVMAGGYGIAWSPDSSLLAASPGGLRRLRRPRRRPRAAPHRPLPVHVPWRDRNVGRLVAGRESDRVHQRTRQRRQHDPPGRNRRRRRSTPGGSWASGLAVGWPLWRPDRRD